MAKIPGPRKPGQTGGFGGHRSNKGSFRAAGGRVPPPPSKPSLPGKGVGCPLSVLAPALVLSLLVLAACQLT